MQAHPLRAPSPLPSGGELPALTGARFFAALAVVVYHYGATAMPASLGSLVAAGPAAVSFFYVLSGAVVTWSGVDATGAPKRPPRAFWVARAARVLPAYWLALVASIPPFVGHALRVHGPSAAWAKITVGAAANLLLVQVYFPPIALGLNSPGWSVSCEAFFYALWPRLAPRLTPRRVGFPWAHVVGFWGLALVGPGLGMAALLGERLPAGAYWTLDAPCDAAELVVRATTYFPPLRVFEFALGITLGHALRTSPLREHSEGADTLRELGLGALSLALSYVVGSGLFGALSGRPLLARALVEGPMLAPLFAALVWQLARGRGLLVRTLSRPALRRLGEASYSLYILQEPVLVWSSATLKRVRPELLAHARPFFAGYVLLLVGASLLAHRYVEVPGRAWLARRLAPWAKAQPRR